MGRDACAIGDSAYTGALTGAPDAAREAAAITPAYTENVGSQFLSLLHSIYVQHSPRACEPSDIPNKHGP